MSSELSTFQNFLLRLETIALKISHTRPASMPAQQTTEEKKRIHSFYEKVFEYVNNPFDETKFLLNFFFNWQKKKYYFEQGNRTDAMDVIDNYTRNTIIFGDLSWDYSTSVLVPAKTIVIVVDQSKFINHSSQQHTTWMSLFPFISELIQYEYDAINENLDISKINQKTSKDYITSLLKKKIEMLSNKGDKTHPESETMKGVAESFEIYTEDDLLPDILMNFGNSSLDDHHHNVKEQEIIANNNNNIFSDPFKKGKILGAIDWTQYFHSYALDSKGGSVYRKFKEGHKYGKLLENLDAKKTKIYLSELLDKIQEIVATDPIQDRNLDIIILQKNFERCVYQPGKNIVFGNPLSIKPSKKDLYKNCLKKYACLNNHLQTHGKKLSDLLQIEFVSRNADQAKKKNFFASVIFEKMCLRIYHKRQEYLLFYQDICCENKETSSPKNKPYIDKYMPSKYYLDTSPPVRSAQDESFVYMYDSGKASAQQTESLTVPSSGCLFPYNENTRLAIYLFLFYDNISFKNIPTFSTSIRLDKRTMIYQDWKILIKKFILDSGYKNYTKLYFDFMKNSFLGDKEYKEGKAYKTLILTMAEQVFRENNPGRNFSAISSLPIEQKMELYYNEPSRKGYKFQINSILNDINSKFDVFDVTKENGYALFWPENEKTKLKQHFSDDFWDKYNNKHIIRDKTFPYLTPVEFMLANYTMLSEKDPYYQINFFPSYAAYKFRSTGSKKSNVQPLINFPLTKEQEVEHFAVDYGKAFYIYKGLSDFLDFVISCTTTHSKGIENTVSKIGQPDLYTPSDQYTLKEYFENYVTYYGLPHMKKIFASKVYKYVPVFSGMDMMILDYLLTTGSQSLPSIYPESCLEFDKTPSKELGKEQNIGKSGSVYFDFSKKSAGELENLEKQMDLYVRLCSEKNKGIFFLFYTNEVYSVPGYQSIWYLIKTLKKNYFEIKTDPSLFYWLFPIAGDTDTLTNNFKNFQTLKNTKVEEGKKVFKTKSDSIDELASSEEVLKKYFYFVLVYLDYYGFEFHYLKFSKKVQFPRYRGEFSHITPSLLSYTNKINNNKFGVFNIMFEVSQNPLTEIPFTRFVKSLVEMGFWTLAQTLYNDVSEVLTEKVFYGNNVPLYLDKTRIVPIEKVREYVLYLDKEIQKYPEEKKKDNSLIKQVLEYRIQDKSVSPFQSIILDFYADEIKFYES